MSAIFISHSSKDNDCALEMQSWLKAQGYHSYFLDLDQETGIQGGTDWEQVLYQRLRQCQAVIAIVTPDWLESKWCFAEVVQAREKGKAVLPAIIKPCKLNGVLSDTQGIDFTQDANIGYARLLSGLKQQGLDSRDSFPWNSSRPPYPGLPAYQEEDAAVFMGRTPEIYAVKEKLDGLRLYHREARRLVLVLGPSGSGKSSLMRAGVIPRLKKDHQHWLPLHPFRPIDEATPIDAFISAVLSTYQDLSVAVNGEQLHNRLILTIGSPQQTSKVLVAMLRELTHKANRAHATILITIDQAEELFSGNTPEATKVFLELLGNTLAQEQLPVMAVATLRSDFLSTFQSALSLCEPTIHAGLKYVPITVEPVPAARVAEIIEGPARKAGLVLEEGLVPALMRDVGQPDALPLLAFMLRRLYDLNQEDLNVTRRGKLELREYEQLGKLEGAVRNAAERILELTNPDPEEITALHSAFIPGLIQVQAEGSYSRRHAYWEELPAEAYRLLNHFVNQRLLETDVDKESKKTVEIAHEALMRTWPRLQAWLLEDRDKLRQYNAVRSAAKDWNEHGRKSDHLTHRDGRLKDAEDLIAASRFDFREGTIESIYLKACIVEQQRRQDAEKEQQERKLKDAQALAAAQQRDLENAQKLAEVQQQQLQAAKELTKAKQQDLEKSKKITKSQRLIIGIAVVSAVALGVFAYLMNLNKQEAQNQLAKNYWASATGARRENELSKYLHLMAEALSSSKDEAFTNFLLADAQALLPSARFSTLIKHDDYVFGAVFSQDERRVLTWSRDKTARVWDAATSEQVGKPMQHDDYIMRAVFSKDGRRVLTCSADNTARLWDAATGEPVGKPMQHNHWVLGAVFSKDEQRVLTWSYDSTARLWNAATSEQVGKSMQHDHWVLGAIFSKDEQRVLTWSDDSTARLWNAATSEQVGKPMQHNGAVNGAVFSKDERRVLTCSRDSTARLWDAATSEQVGKPMQHDHWIFRAVFSKDERRVLTWSQDKTARLWDAATGLAGKGKTFYTSMGHEGAVWGAVFSKDEQRVLTWSQDKTARLWNAATGPAGKRMQHEGTVRGAVFSKDERRVLTWSEDNTARIWEVDRIWEAKWNAATREPVGKPMQHDDYIIRAVFSKDEQRVLTWCQDKTARIWNAETGEQVGKPMQHDHWINGAVFSKAERKVLSWSDDSTARLWDAATSEQVGKPMKHEGAVLGAVFSKDEQRVLTWSGDSTVRIWDAATSEQVGKPMQHKGYVWGVVFSKDEQRVLSWSADKTARLWDAATSEQVGKPMQHDDDVSGAVFSKDEQRVLTWSEDKTARLWEVETGEQVGKPMQHYMSVNGAVFSKDERRVLTWSGDNTARIWDAATSEQAGKPMQHNGAVNGAVFSKDERRVLTCSRDKTARIWEVETGEQVGKPMQHNGAVNGAVFSQDERRVLTWSADMTARIWNVEVDLDIPATLFKLQIQALTGTFLGVSSQEVTLLPVADWQAKRQQYEQQAREHYKTCQHPNANLWARFYPEEAKKIRPEVSTTSNRLATK